MKPYLKKLLRRILRILAVLLISLLVFGFFFYDDAKQWLAGKVQQYVSEMGSGELVIEEVDLAFFRHLPNVTVRLNNVQYFEAKDSLRNVDDLPMLNAQRINLAFEPWQLIKNRKFKLTALSIEESGIDLVIFEDGITNLEKVITSAEESEDGIPNTSDPESTAEADSSEMEIDLKNLEIENLRLNYSNPAEKQASSFMFTSIEGDIQITQEGFSCDLSSDFEILKSAMLPAISELGPVSSELKINYIEASDELQVSTGEINLENLILDITGSYQHTNNRLLDLTIDASSQDISLFSALIRDKMLSANRSSIDKADLVLKGQVQGSLNDDMPNIDVEFGIKDLSLTIPNGKGSFQDFGFDGEFHSGEANDLSQAILSITNLRGQIPGGNISGNFIVNDFRNPYVNSNLKADIELNGYDEIFHLNNVDSLQGRVRLVTDYNGSIQLESQQPVDHLGKWSLTFSDIGFKHLPTAKNVEQLNGVVSDSLNVIKLDSIRLNYGNRYILTKGTIKNVYNLIFRDEQNIHAELEIRSPELFTADFFPGTDTMDLGINDRISDLYIKTKLKTRKNDRFDSDLPAVLAEIDQLSFSLDKLADIKALRATVDLYELDSLYQADFSNMAAQFTKGSANGNGQLRLPADFETLAITTSASIEGFPDAYILDLIREINDLKVKHSAEIPPEELSLLSGNIVTDISMAIDPFAVLLNTTSSSKLVMKLPDGGEYSFEGIEFSAEDIYFLRDAETTYINGLKSARGEVHIEKIGSPMIKNLPLDARFTATNDTVTVDFDTTRSPVTREKGRLSVNLAEEPLNFDLHFELQDMSVEEVVGDYSEEQLMAGLIDVNLQFTWSGTDIEEIIPKIEGRVTISGDTITLYGLDMDKLLRKYERSQNFNLADVSAFVVAGPFGTAVTKGSDFASLIGTDLDPTQKTVVTRALAAWKIQDGIVSAEDVAFRTSKNLVAMKGTIDIANDSIPGMMIYVVDKNGCSLMEQKIYGKTNDIQTGNLKIAKTLLGSVINLVNAVVGSNCETVYNGAIEHPENAE